MLYPDDDLSWNPHVRELAIEQALDKDDKRLISMISQLRSTSLRHLVISYNCRIHGYDIIRWRELDKLLWQSQFFRITRVTVVLTIVDLPPSHDEYQDSEEVSQTVNLPRFCSRGGALKLKVALRKLDPLSKCFYADHSNCPNRLSSIDHENDDLRSLNKVTDQKTQPNPSRQSVLSTP